MKSNRQDDQLEIVLEENLVASHLDAQELAIREVLNAEDGVNHVVLNMEQVEEIDSLGINLVVGFYKELKGRSIGFSVAHTSRQIRNLFNLFKLSSYFEVS